ncbi:MAG: phosphoenolpyruvate carboxykinase (ATP), partial [Eubacterium aggregans]
MKKVDLNYLGIKNEGLLNLGKAALITRAAEKEEGQLVNSGALATYTGKYTGRSPDDRFVVDDEVSHDTVEWGKTNVPFSEEKFEALYEKLTAYASNANELLVFDGFAGVDTDYRLPIRVVDEYASHSLFARNLFINAAEGEVVTPEFTVISMPGFLCDPEIDGTHSEAAIILSFKEKVVLIAWTKYCGETKKFIFSVMNYLLPQRNVFPMHCSANMGKDGDTALFFG